MTVERCKNKFFPDWNNYIILANTSSDKQIEYEEKVLRQIIQEHGGTFLSESYKPEVLEASSHGIMTAYGIPLDIG